MKNNFKKDLSVIKIQGNSDDYITIKGENYSRQHDLRFGEPCQVVFSDGTSFSISYGNQDRGTWDVTNLVKGSKFLEFIPFVDEDSDYSDIVVLEECDCLAPVYAKIK